MGVMTQVQKVGAPQRRIDNIVRRVAKTFEEGGELAEATLSATSVSGSKGKQWMDIVEEAVDVAIMGLDIALTKPPEWQDIDDDMWRAIVKKIFSLKLKKWQRQVRLSATLIDEKLPQFTEEEHQEFLALLREPVALNEMTAPPKEDAVTRKQVEASIRETLPNGAEI